MGYTKRINQKPKRRFAGIPVAVMDHPDYIALNGNAIKLLIEAARQYNGKNNGKLCFVWSQMKNRGWKSKTTLTAAKNELLHRKLLIISKHGGLINGAGTAQFYALTWQQVDEISGFEMDIDSTSKPIRSFTA